MHQLFSNHDPGGSGSGLRDITRSIRQFCLLHELGSDGEAVEQQSQKLDELITAFRAAHGADSLSDERLRVLLLDEQERVATAAAMSATLAPLLTRQLQLAPPSPARTRRIQPGADGPQEPFARPAGVQSVADMIDGMLIQDAEDAPAIQRRRA